MKTIKEEAKNYAFIPNNIKYNSDIDISREKDFVSGAEMVQKHILDRAIITRGAMILDGYDEYDSCIKYMNEFINEIKELEK